MTGADRRERRAALRGWMLLPAGVAGATLAFTLRPEAARHAAAQDWSPFVLVAGLLLIGLVADGDGLFGYAGRQLARVAGSGMPSLAPARGLPTTCRGPGSCAEQEPGP